MIIIPIHCKMVTASFRIRTDEIIATGNSAALKIPESPSGTCGVQIAKRKTGNAEPNNPKTKP